MAKRNPLRGIAQFLFRTANRWKSWPAGVLPLPARPASRKFAFDRGTPIDRRIIEAFLESHAADIRGRVLEVADRGYTERFGGARVTRSDVLHAVVGNPEATIIGDLATGRGLVWGAYDCLVLTQTLHVIYDIQAVVANLHRMLKPGGTALVTIPGISQVSRYDADRWGDFWRMTPQAARRLFAEAFSDEGVAVESYGNVRLAAAYLYGLAAEEVDPGALSESDPDYPLLVCVRAVKKPVAEPKGKRSGRGLRGGKLK
ncbi:MAG: class I SAM-dependent methyltransferase [Anaerolineales bacterium]|nr:class I SAM-dependent methyltransferase [Anaerolineales bacterium]